MNKKGRFSLLFVLLLGGIILVGVSQSAVADNPGSCDPDVCKNGPEGCPIKYCGKKFYYLGPPPTGETTPKGEYKDACIRVPEDTEACTSQGGSKCGTCDCCFPENDEKCNTATQKCCVTKYGATGTLYSKGAEFESSECCERGAEAKYFPGGDPRCCSAGQEVYATAGGSPYSEDRPWLSTCCDAGLGARYDAIGVPRCCRPGQQTHTVAEGSEKAGTEPWRSYCCASDNAVAYSELGTPICCGPDAALYTPAQGSSKKELFPWMSTCCNEDREVSYDEDGAATCCAGDESTYGPKIGSEFEDEYPWFKICCNKDVSYSPEGQPYCCETGKVYNEGERGGSGSCCAQGAPVSYDWEGNVGCCQQGETPEPVVTSEEDAPVDWTKCCGQDQTAMSPGNSITGMGIGGIAPPIPRPISANHRATCCAGEVDVETNYNGALSCCEDGQTAVPVATTSSDANEDWTKCCSPGEKAVGQGSDAICVAGCCETSDQCSRKCRLVDEAENVYRVSNYECIVHDGDDKGVCAESTTITQIGLKQSETCENNEVDEPERCQPATEPVIECSQEGCAAQTSCDIIHPGGRHDFDTITDIVAGKTCVEEDNPRYSEYTRCRDNNEDGTKVIVDTCNQENEVCIEHRANEEPHASSAQCEACPSSMSFGDNSQTQFLADGSRLYTRSAGVSTLVGTVENTQFVDNFGDAIFQLRNICQKCKGARKLDFVSFHGDMVLSQNYDYIGNDPYLFPELQNCMNQVYVTRCAFAGNTANQQLLADLMGAPVTGGTSSTTGDSDTGGTFEINNPTTVENTDTSTESPNTVYYLANPNSLYPGYDSEVYQVNILKGKVGDIELNIANYLANPMFVSVEDTPLACDATIVEENILRLDAQSAPITFNTLTLTVLDGTFPSLQESAEIRLRLLEMDCTKYEKRAAKPSLPSREEVETVEAAVANGLLENKFLEDITYRYDNQIECTKDEDCLDYRCPMGNRDCANYCDNSKCISSDRTLYDLQKQLDSEIVGWLEGKLPLNRDLFTIWGRSVKRIREHDTIDRSESGLILYLPFDKPSITKAYDASGNNRDGTISGATPEKGKIRGALQFNGLGDSVTITHTEALNFHSNDAFTISVWVLMPTDAREAPAQIVGKRGQSGNWVRLFSRDHKLIFEASSGGTIIEIPTSTTYNDGQWHHWVIGRNENGDAIFAHNGVVYHEPLPGDFSNSAEFSIGRWENEGGFDGMIDEVRVYDRGLSDDEIQALFKRK